jgi:hypothetical protein
MLDPLIGEPLAYLATPYTKLERADAVREACRIAAELMISGVRVFSPIAHGHALQAASQYECPQDGDFWRGVNRPFLERSQVLIVAMMPGYERSDGVRDEIRFFERAGRPIFYLCPKRMTMTRRRGGPWRVKLAKKNAAVAI